MTFQPIPFSAGSASILCSLGYVCEHIEADWGDVGGPEYGPRIVGHNAGDVWTRGDHEIIVEGGMIVHAGHFPTGPDFDDIPF